MSHPYLRKFLGDRAPLPPRPDTRAIVLAWMGGLLAIALMMATGTVHPPAGSNPVIVFLLQPGWGFLLLPTLLGSLVVLLYNNAVRANRYPKYW